MDAFHNFYAYVYNWAELHPSLAIFLVIFFVGGGVAIVLQRTDPLFRLQLKWDAWEADRAKKKKEIIDDRPIERKRKIRKAPKSRDNEPAAAKPLPDKQVEIKAMSDLWSPDSLRGMYWFSQQRISSKDIAVSVRNDVGFFKKIALKLEAKTEIIKEHDAKVREYRQILKNPICPHCLKTIITSEISFSCPFCDQKHFEEGTKVQVDGGNISEQVSAAIMTKMAEGMLMATLFNACPKCQSKIQYLSCHHCQKEIDLFAPYNYQELEKKRYGR
jgi:rubrerythrin